MYDSCGEFNYTILSYWMCKYNLSELLGIFFSFFMWEFAIGKIMCKFFLAMSLVWMWFGPFWKFSVFVWREHPQVSNIRFG